MVEDYIFRKSMGPQTQATGQSGPNRQEPKGATPAVVFRDSLSHKSTHDAAGDTVTKDSESQEAQSPQDRASGPNQVKHGPPRRVILESPYAGDVHHNEAYAVKCLRDSLLRGEAPMASHLLYTRALDDLIPSERAMGIAAGLAWSPAAAATVVYVDHGMSQGMRLGIERAARDGRPVEYRTLRGSQYRVAHDGCDLWVAVADKPEADPATAWVDGRELQAVRDELAEVKTERDGAVTARDAEYAEYRKDMDERGNAIAELEGKLQETEDALGKAIADRDGPGGLNQYWLERGLADGRKQVTADYDRELKKERDEVLADIQRVIANRDKFRARVQELESDEQDWFQRGLTAHTEQSAEALRQKQKAIDNLKATLENVIKDRDERISSMSSELATAKKQHDGLWDRAREAVKELGEVRKAREKAASDNQYWFECGLNVGRKQVTADYDRELKKERDEAIEERDELRARVKELEEANLQETSDEFAEINVLRKELGEVRAQRDKTLEKLERTTLEKNAIAGLREGLMAQIDGIAERDEARQVLTAIVNMTSKFLRGTKSREALDDSTPEADG